jgi:hypothetical protein
MSTTNCQPPNCPCFCPAADVPVAPIIVAQGGPAGVFQIPIYGTQPFSVAIVSNPLLPVTQVPLISLAQVFNGNILTVTTAVPALAETIGPYTAQLKVCNACGELLIDLTVNVEADITPILSDCLLAQQLWTPEARVPAPGDTLLAFTPAGCRALLPPNLDVCAAIQGFPAGAPTLQTSLVTDVCDRVTVADVLALYDLCADIQTFPAAGPLQPNDQIVGVQGGACVLATVADVAAAAAAAFDLCVAFQNLPNAVVQPTAVFMGEQNGGCFQFAVADLGAAIFAGPVLAANGSCAAPTYSFAASPDSGMFYTGTAVRISDDNCTDFIDVGTSINITSTLSTVTATAGTSAGGNTGAVLVLTGGSDAPPVTGGGGINGGTTPGGRSGGSISTGVWIGAASVPALLRGPGDSAGSGASVQVKGGTGGAGVGGIAFIDGGDGSIASGDVMIRAGLPSGAVHVRFEGVGGAWVISGSPGAPGERLTSQGPGVPPSWLPAAGAVAEPVNQIVYGTGAGVDSDADFTYVPALGQFRLNSLGFGPTVSSATPGEVLLWGVSGIGVPGGYIAMQAGTGGTSSAGGSVFITGGSGGGTAGNGGSVEVTGGNAVAIGATGGLALVQGGTPGANGNGGSVSVTGRAGVGTNRNGGNVTITAGARTGTGIAGVIDLVMAATGELRINGSPGGAGERLTSQGPGLPPIWAP